MVGLGAQRAAAQYLRQQYEVSERRACQVLGANRSSVRWRSRRQAPGWRLRLRELAGERPRYGYRRLWRQLRREGHRAGAKAVWRACHQAGLALARPRKRRRRAAANWQPLAAERPNQYWAMDFMQDQLVNGRRVRLFNVIDICTRESLATEADARLSSGTVERVLEQIAAERGYPEAVQCDNGSEFTSRRLARWSAQQRVRLHFSQPGRPMQNGFIESFNGRMRDECLTVHEFATVSHLRAVVTAWRADYNQVRPHSGLDGLTPSQAAQKHRAGSEPAALRPPDASLIHRSNQDPQPAECLT